jgi:hypothetical protein
MPKTQSARSVFADDATLVPATTYLKPADLYESHAVFTLVTASRRENRRFANKPEQVFRVKLADGGEATLTFAVPQDGTTNAGSVSRLQAEKALASGPIEGVRIERFASKGFSDHSWGFAAAE